MRLRILFIGMVLSLCAAALPAQEILPHSFRGWTGSAPSPVSSIDFGSGPGATTTAQQQAAVQREYEFVSGESEKYTRGAAMLQVSVYKMADPSGAYGLYTYLRTPDMSRASITEESSLSSNRALLLVGNLVLDVRGDDPRKDAADLKALAADVSPHAKHGALPTLWENLPAKNFQQGTDRYILGPQTLDQLFPVPLGDALEFSHGAEAEVARYHLKGGEATLLLADFPTPQIARTALGNLKKAFDLNGSKPASGSPALYAKRALTMLAIVVGPRSAAQADTLLSQVHSDEVLTWNEPALGLTQPSFATMVVGVFVGTGVLCAFALVASLAFGGFRLMVKRMLPGKVFDRSHNLQVLQLGIYSKPIRAEDFYDRSGPRIKGKKVDKNLPDRVALRIFR